MFLSHPRGTDNDWSVPRYRDFPQTGGCLDAAHIRHADVHKNQVGSLTQRFLHADFAIVCLKNLKAQVTNNHGEELAAISIIFDQQHFVGHKPLLESRLCAKAESPFSHCDRLLSSCSECTLAARIAKGQRAGLLEIGFTN